LTITLSFQVAEKWIRDPEVLEDFCNLLKQCMTSLSDSVRPFTQVNLTSGFPMPNAINNKAGLTIFNYKESRAALIASTVSDSFILAIQMLSH